MTNKQLYSNIRKYSVNKSAINYYKMYRKMRHWNLLNVSSFELLFRRIGLDAFVLDVGCGIGYLSRIFPSYVGVDLNITCLRIAKEYFPTLSCVCASGTCLPFKDNCFDACVAYDCIEHVENTELLLSEIARVAQKFFIGCIDFQSWYQIVTRTVRLDRTHVFSPSYEGLIKFMGNMFRIQKVYRTCGIFYLPRKLNRLFARFFPEYTILECMKLSANQKAFSELNKS